MHSRAVGHLLSASPIVTSDFVLIELGNALSRGDRHQSYGMIIENLKQSGKARLVPFSRDYFERGISLMISRIDKDWSLIDCTSFEITRDLDLEEALTTDKHFEQAGFHALLR